MHDCQWNAGEARTASQIDDTLGPSQPRAHRKRIEEVPFDQLTRSITRDQIGSRAPRVEELREGGKAIDAWSADLDAEGRCAFDEKILLRRAQPQTRQCYGPAHV